MTMRFRISSVRPDRVWLGRGRRRRGLPLLLLAPLVLGGCQTAGGRLGASPETTVVTGIDALPRPGDVDIATGTRPFRIGPHDSLVIEVFGVSGMEPREIVADSAGRISYPLAGTIDAAGMTPEQLRDTIALRLRAAHVRQPQVTVNVKEAASQMVTVDGEVRMPGVYPVTGAMTLMRAVAAAQGLDQFASESDVVVLRTVGGRRYAGLYNLAAIRRGNYPDPEIYAADTVIVGESRQRQLFADFLGLLPLLTTPVIVALQN